MKKLVIIYLMILLCLNLVQATTVTRSISPSGTIPTDTDMTVTLNVDVTGSDTYYLIDEKLTSGLTIFSVSGNGDYTTTPGHIFWVVLQNAQDTSYTYHLKSSSSKSVIFSGTYGSESKKESPILGTNSLTIGQGGDIPPDTSSSSTKSFPYILGGIIILLLIFGKKLLK